MDIHDIFEIEITHYDIKPFQNLRVKQKEILDLPNIYTFVDEFIDEYCNKNRECEKIKYRKIFVDQSFQYLSLYFEEGRSMTELSIKKNNSFLEHLK